MAPLDWEIFEDDWGIDPCILHPHLEPPATTTLVPMSISFLTLPREVRDEMYRYLLSTKYTKHVFSEPSTESMHEEYGYHFHPSILRTNRQIECEASHVLYTENSLIRVSSCGHEFSANVFGRCDGGHAVPIVARGERAEMFSRHAMELLMLREIVMPREEWRPPSNWDWTFYENCFVIASDDLPRFCQALLVMDTSSDQGLDRLTLAIEVYTDGAAVAIVPFEGGHILVEGERSTKDDTPAKDHTSIKDDTPAKDHTSIKDDTSTKDHTSTKEAVLTQEEAANLTQPTRSTCPSTHILRLLEPLHKLHSLQGVYIEASINEDYKTNLLHKMYGPPPSNQEMFNIVLAMFEDAMSTYETGDQCAALTKIKVTLDTMKFQESVREDDLDGSAVIPTGPYAGYTIWDAQQDMKVNIWTQIAWTHLEVGDMEHVCEARNYAWMIIGAIEGLSTLHPTGHEAAMAVHLKAHIWEAFDRLGDNDLQKRSYFLERVVRILEEGLRHEPGNPLLEQELRRRVDELEIAEETEALMEMSDRINGRGIFAQSEGDEGDEAEGSRVFDTGT